MSNFQMSCQHLLKGKNSSTSDVSAKINRVKVVLPFIMGECILLKHIHLSNSFPTTLHSTTALLLFRRCKHIVTYTAAQNKHCINSRRIFHCTRICRPNVHTTLRNVLTESEGTEEEFIFSTYNVNIYCTKNRF
jgi:hypothetical protein